MIEIDEAKMLDVIWNNFYGEEFWDGITEQLYAQMMGWA